MYQNIPTNIITGFLGAGKTTAIQQLLSQKPANERWAVLVNEFGEVGIDASMMEGSSEQGEQVFISEVPGGCMCCTAGLPMSIALNQLIRKASPDRLLIEPTGLGHPEEVIATLLQPEYREVLDIRATLTLVDARKLSDARYRDHEIFRQQLRVADRVIASKSDLYTGDEFEQLQAFLKTLSLDVAVSEADQGSVETDWLLPESGYQAEASHHHSHHGDASGALATDDELPECGYLRKDNKGQGYCSSGWVFSPEFEFQFDALEGLLNGLDVERMKAVFITDDGIYAFNLADGVLSVKPLDEVWDSRIEVIGTEPDSWQSLEQDLLAISVRL